MRVSGTAFSCSANLLDPDQESIVFSLHSYRIISCTDSYSNSVHHDKPNSPIMDVVDNVDGRVQRTPNSKKSATVDFERTDFVPNLSKFEQSSHQFARPWTLNARTDKKFEEDNIDSEMEIGSGSKCFKEKYK